MTTVHDVAAYIVQEQGSMSAMKLQKLVYYSQAWHLVWESKALFPERIEAWANGPVVYELFDKHRGRFSVSDWAWGKSTALNDDEQSTIDAVLGGYGNLDGRKLSVMTHDEDPWKNARQGLSPDERSNREITLEALHTYYQAVAEDARAVEVEEMNWTAWESGAAEPPF